jgi:hypothetical protein
MTIKLEKFNDIIILIIDWKIFSIPVIEKGLIFLIYNTILEISKKMTTNKQKKWAKNINSWQKGKYK